MREYNESLIKAFKLSEVLSNKSNSKNVNLFHLFISIIETNKDIKKITKKYKINKKDFIEYKNNNNKKGYNYFNKDIKNLIEQINYNKEDNEKIIDEFDILNTILSNDNNGVYKILISNNVNIEEFKKDINNINRKMNTTLLDLIAVNLNEEAKSGKFDKIYIREKEINRIIEILARRNKNNPLLIGEAGVGKTAIIEELANRIVSNTAPIFLKNKIIYSLNISSLIAGTKYRGEFEEKLNKIIDEITNNNNIILFIDEVHTIIGAGGAEGAIDASNIFKPALARGQIKVIGATTIKEYKQTIEKDKALDRRFQKVFISPSNLTETKYILQKTKKNYEKYHNVKISDEIIDNIILLADKYIHNRHEPDRSIDILDEVCVKANVKSINNDLFNLTNIYNKTIEEKNKLIKYKHFDDAKKLKDKENNIKKKIKNILNNSKKRIITIEDLKNVIREKSNGHILEFDTDDIINKNKNLIKKKIIGQDKQIDKLFNIIKLENFNGTIIKICGNKNVGKTSTIKLLSKLFMKNLIILNMNEYSNEMSINKIIGSSQGYIGYNDQNTIFEIIKLYPDSIIMINNFKNANKNVYNLLIDIMENKILTLSSGEVINFKACSFFIIDNYNNSNLGFINNNINNIYEDVYTNHIINYNDLTKKDIRKIINNELKEIIENNNIKYKLDEKDYEYIINNSNFNKNGNNKIQNIIKNYIYEKVNFE